MVELLGEEEEVGVECETDWEEEEEKEEEHRWSVRQLNQTFPVPASLITRLGSSSKLRLSKR